MKISTKGRYALRLMLDMAQCDREEYVPLANIANRQNISKNYLDQIMILLKRGNFFISARGHQGGYKLAKNPADYSVGAILRLTEGSIAPARCLEHCGGDECEREAKCMAIHVWQGLENVVENYLDKLTLQDILDKYALPQNAG